MRTDSLSFNAAELYGAKGYSVTRNEDLKPVFQTALRPTTSSSSM
jgi:thiamine pyrophosphate-dependent acetolactate synthase large subunit-like protein